MSHEVIKTKFIEREGDSNNWRTNFRDKEINTTIKIRISNAVFNISFSKCV